MLGNHRPMDITRIRHDYLALDEIREHQLMHRGCGRVNPLELVRRHKVLRTYRPADQDVSIRNLLRQLLIMRKVHNPDLRKITGQSFANPRRRTPELETMLMADKNFHE